MKHSGLYNYVSYSKDWYTLKEELDSPIWLLNTIRSSIFYSELIPVIEMHVAGRAFKLPWQLGNPL